MSHLSDSESEKKIDVNSPSSAQQSTSQPFRPKRSQNNRLQDHQSPKQTSNKSQKHSAKAKVEHNQSHNVASSSQTNVDVSNLTTAFVQNLNLHTKGDEVGQAGRPKGKNAKKKERKKQLQMPSQNVPHNIPQSSHQAQYANTSRQEVSGVRNSSRNARARNSRYLENVSHHPQYLFSQNVQMGAHFPSPRPASSVPNSPGSFSPQMSTSGSIPNSPMVNPFMQPMPTSGSIPNSQMLQLGDMSPKCLQNVMQHPLLSQSYTANLQRQSNQAAGYEANTTQEHKINKKKTDTGFKFDPYLSAEEVEVGLKDNTLIEGAIRINPKQFRHSYVSSSDSSEQDILIDGMYNRNRAMEGDIVVLKLIESDSEERPEEGEKSQKKGKVVYIKEKVHNRTCIGHLKLMSDSNRQKALFIPRDHRVPRLNVAFTTWPDDFFREHKSYANTLFLCQIRDWVDTRFALGEIVRIIGESGDMHTESLVILTQTDLDITPFGSEVKHLYPPMDYQIPEEEFSIREDCRKLCLFSIDPFNCRDIDDAVSCRELENGNYEIGVHIADVAHFLTEDTILDEKVAEKATTIYLVEKAYHMLPDDLCMLCSLFPGVDKLAFSVFWEITKNAEVLSHRFSKTVINSCAQLAYEHCQSVLDDKEDAEASFPEIYNGFEYKDLHKVIKSLGGISAIFRTNRFNGGALRIDQPKIAFHLNPANGLPDSFLIHEGKQSHQLIEEFMLLANMTVAKRINDDHPKLAFLRCHPKPNGFMLKQLVKSLEPMGIELKVSSAGDLHRSLLPHVDPNNTDRGKFIVLNMLCAKPMARAKYFCADGCDDEEFHHYALNVPLYTHFTSPIRRYADIMVHRLMAASLNYRETPTWEVDKVRQIAAQCNKQKYNSKKASDLSTELYTRKYIEMNSPIETDAAVVEIKEKSIDVIVIAMGFNGRIFLDNSFPGEFRLIKHEGGSKLAKMELTWKAEYSIPPVEQVIEVFSILRIKLCKYEDENKIHFKLVRPISN